MIENKTETQLTEKQKKMLNKLLETALTHLRDEIDGLNATAVEVGLQLVYSDTMEAYNKKYRDIDQPTDVLSFPMYDADMMKPEYIDEELVPLGDIVINQDAVKAQAEAYGHSVERELGFLFLHGLLHLLGYDHQRVEHEKEMFSLQEQLLTEVGLTRHSAY